MSPSASESFYRLLFDNTLDGLAYCQMLFDRQNNPIDFVYLKVNKNFAKLTGLKAVEGKKVTAVIPGIRTSNPELFEIYGRVALTGKPERFETYVAPLSRWFLVSVSCLKKGTFVAIFQNITDRKRIEKDLMDAKIAAQNVLEDLSAEKSKVEAAQAKEEAILLAIGDGLLVTDEKGQIIRINKTAEGLLGRKSADLVGKIFSEEVSMTDEKGGPISPAERPINLALAASTTTTTTTTTTGPIYYYVRNDQTKFPAAMVVTPVILGDKVIGAVEVFRDITREKEIDQAKSEFISLASHQLKTPPTTIKLLTERLLEKRVGILTEKQREYFNDIRSANQRMIDLVNALLNVSRIELGAFTIQVDEKDAGAIVQSVLDESQSAADKKGLSVKTILPAEKVKLRLDESLFRMVINNLVTNAISYTAAGGAIEVRGETRKKGERLGGKLLADNYFVVTVSDTGYGIPEDQQGRVFTKFFRADNARAKQTDGTGLGLYIVKSVLEHCGGLIWLTSRENEGSTFYAAIPLTGMKARAGV